MRERYIPKTQRREQELQLQICRYMDLRLPNVIYRSDFGSGLFMSPYQAKLHKAMQSSKSFPDMFFYEPRRGYHGMGLEIKKEGTTLIVKRGPRKGRWVNDPHILEQVMFLKELAKRGYYTNIVAGYDEAIKTINWYFGIEQGEQKTIF